MLRRVVLAMLLVLAAMMPAGARDYLDDTQRRVAALDALFVRAGETRPIVRISFQPEEIELIAESDSGDDFSAWRARRVDLMLFSFNYVDGPRRVSAALVVDDRTGSFFGRSEVHLAQFDGVVRAAIAFAQLQTAPDIERVELARRASILPTPSYGDVQWTVTLRTSNERATVMLDKAGNVVGSDLSDTVRGREIDLLVRDDWQMAEAQRLIARAIEGARVHELTVYKDGISLTADHPTDASLQRGYNWSLEGVRRDPFDVPNLVKLGLGDKVSFDFGEIDLTSLPAIKGAAREAYGSPSATMTEITASKPTHTASALLQVMWEAEFREANGETGSVWLTRDGAVLEVDLPPSRRPVAGPWLAPETIADTLARITETFGADARLYSIIIDDELARLDIEDPRAPGQLAQFLVYPDKIERWGSPSFFADLAPDHVFTMADLAPLTAETIAALSARTLERLTGDGFAIFRYTISRQALLLDPRDTRLMVEIRAGLDNGIGTSGWVTFTLDGEIADELQP